MMIMEMVVWGIVDIILTCHLDQLRIHSSSSQGMEVRLVQMVVAKVLRVVDVNKILDKRVLMACLICFHLMVVARVP